MVNLYDLYGVSYKMLIKDIKEDMNKWEKTVFLDWKFSSIFSYKYPQTDL